MITYGFKKELNMPYEQACEKVEHELKNQGFGILTKIDIREKFKEKLGIEFKKYIILGACNPSNAHKAIEAEEDIGLFLPCNVIIYEKDANKSVISVIKPTTAMSMVENNELKNTAVHIESLLKNVFNSIE